MHICQKFTVGKKTFYTNLFFCQINSYKNANMKSDVAASDKKSTNELLISLDCGGNTLNTLICFLCANKP